MPRLASIAAAVFALTLLGACGGSSNSGAVPSAGAANTSRSSGGSAIAAAPARGNGKGANGRRPDTGKGGMARRADPVSRHDRPARAQHPKGHSEVRRTGPRGLNPCTLLKRSEGRAIVGMAIAKPRLGLEGPTCVYQTRRLEQPITVSLQQGSLPALTRLGRNIVHTAIAGHKAVCLNSGGLKLLLMPVTTGSVLTIGAPCPLAEHFAATALRRLR